MSTQTPRRINTEEVGPTGKIERVLPEEGMLIQTIIHKPTGDTLLPGDMTVKNEITKLHQQGQDAYIILCAPVIPKKQISSHFEHAHNDGYKRYVVTKAEIILAGLDNTAQVRKDANTLRNQARNPQIGAQESAPSGLRMRVA